jgi:hypothetical protein
MLRLEDGNLYLRLRKMSHTIYAANGKVSHIQTTKNKQTLRTSLKKGSQKRRCHEECQIILIENYSRTMSSSRFTANNIKKTNIGKEKSTIIKNEITHQSPN